MEGNYYLNENSEFNRQLKAAVASGNSQSLEAITSRIGNIVLEEGVLPEEFFLSILAALQDEHFLRLDGSWKLLRVFEENWKELSELQRAALLPALEAAYESFHDWMACFVVSGILGELYGDERAFGALRRLQNTQKEMPRSFVPHGFEHMAGDRSNESLAQRALEELTKMERDDSEMVRGEVRESFSRLRKRESKSKEGA